MHTPPIMAPYGRHILFCTGHFCDPEGQARRLYARLARKLGDLGQYDNPERVKRGTTPCLGVCTGGHLLAVYPDGIWYHHVDETVLDRIIDEHLYNDCPVDEYIFHRLDSGHAEDSGHNESRDRSDRNRSSTNTMSSDTKS